MTASRRSAALRSKKAAETQIVELVYVHRVEAVLEDDMLCMEASDGLVVEPLLVLMALAPGSAAHRLTGLVPCRVPDISPCSRCSGSRRTDHY